MAAFTLTLNYTHQTLMQDIDICSRKIGKIRKIGFKAIPNSVLRLAINGRRTAFLRLTFTAGSCDAGFESCSTLGLAAVCTHCVDTLLVVVAHVGTLGALVNIWAGCIQLDSVDMTISK